MNQETHRPWPVSARPWATYQRLNHLLFAHWPVPVSAVQPYIPKGVEVDTFDGTAWIGIVPFRLTHFRSPVTPPLPGISTFLEINVRTYVTDGEKHGVYFFSLNANHPVIVLSGQVLFHVNWRDARISSEISDGWVEYAAVRTHRGLGPGEFLGRYRPVGPVYLADRNSLEFWLSERYCLYTEWRGTLLRAEIHHPQWPLQEAEAEIELNSLPASDGVWLPAELPPLVHYSRHIEMWVWPPTRVR
jgi:uncharacterized protein YqjF (DUF2071 family)